MSSDANPATPAVGTLSAADGAGVVRIEQRYDTDETDLWSALTDPARLAGWYGQIDGELREGGHIRVRIDGPDIDSTGRIVECQAPSWLRVQTRETDESARRGNGRPFDQTVDLKLTPDGDHTVLVVEVHGLPLDKIAAYGIGWQLHAETLASYISDRPGPDIAARWAELDQAYRTLAAQLP